MPRWIGQNKHTNNSILQQDLLVEDPVLVPPRYHRPGFSNSTIRHHSGCADCFFTSCIAQRHKTVVSGVISSSHAEDHARIRLECQTIAIVGFLLRNEQIVGITNLIKIASIGIDVPGVCDRRCRHREHAKTTPGPESRLNSVSF